MNSALHTAVPNGSLKARGRKRFLSNGSEPDLKFLAGVKSNNARTAPETLDNGFLVLAREKKQSITSPSTAAASPPGQEPPRKLKCTHAGCDKVYSRVDSLKRRVKDKHGEVKDRVVKFSFNGRNETYMKALVKQNDARKAADNLDDELLMLAGETPELLASSSNTEPPHSSDPLLKEKEDQSQKFKCTHAVCDKVYSRIDALNRHIKAKHEKAKDRVVEFSFNGRSETDMKTSGESNDTRTALGNLDDELLMLTGETPELLASSSTAEPPPGQEQPQKLKCTHAGCNETFSRRFTLNRHVHMKHGKGKDQVFMCTFQGCNKTYREYGGMVKHMRKEHQQNPSSSGQTSDELLFTS
ncbi:hypothetical protein RUND412_003071 [Rhizina undulata]